MLNWLPPLLLASKHRYLKFKFTRYPEYRLTLSSFSQLAVGEFLHPYSGFRQIREISLKLDYVPETLSRSFPPLERACGHVPSVWVHMSLVISTFPFYSRSILSPWLGLPIWCELSSLRCIKFYQDARKNRKKVPLLFFVEMGSVLWKRRKFGKNNFKENMKSNNWDLLWDNFFLEILIVNLDIKYILKLKNRLKHEMLDKFLLSHVSDLFLYKWFIFI